MSGGAGPPGSCSKPVPSGALLWKRRGQGTATFGHHTGAGPVFPLAGVFCTGTALGLKGDDAPPPGVTVRPTHSWSVVGKPGQAVVGHVLTPSAPSVRSLGRMGFMPPPRGAQPSQASCWLSQSPPSTCRTGWPVSTSGCPPGLALRPLPGSGTKWAS